MKFSPGRDMFHKHSTLNQREPDNFCPEAGVPCRLVQYGSHVISEACLNFAEPETMYIADFKVETIAVKSTALSCIPDALGLEDPQVSRK